MATQINEDPRNTFYMAGTGTRLPPVKAWREQSATSPSASQVTAVHSWEAKIITLVVCKFICFLKIPLPIHFLLIRIFWNNHWKASPLQTTNVTDCNRIWDLCYSRRGPLFPLVAMVMLQYCCCVFDRFPSQSHWTLKSSHLLNMVQVFWKPNI